MSINPFLFAHQSTCLKHTQLYTEAIYEKHISLKHFLQLIKEITNYNAALCKVKQ